MAADFYPIPTMSAEYDRIFGSAKLLISPHRNPLGENIVEARVYLRESLPYCLIGKVFVLYFVSPVQLAFWPGPDQTLIYLKAEAETDTSSARLPFLRARLLFVAFCLFVPSR
jgi:hypothetical protein